MRAKFLNEMSLDSIDVKEFYKDSPFIRVVDKVETKSVNGTNYCDIKYLGNGIMVSALDNLIKGSAGQAIQNFNLMYGFPQSTILSSIKT